MLKFYRLDDSDNPGWARVKVLGVAGHSPYGGTLYRVQVIEIAKPSTFIKCKVGAIRPRVSQKLLFDTLVMPL